MRARALAEISVVAFFRRHAETLPRASKAARTPVGESAEFRIMLTTFLNCGRAQGRVAVHLDVESARLPCLCIEQMHIARLFVDDCVRAADAFITSKSS